MYTILKLSILTLFLSACQSTQPQKANDVYVNWQLIPNQSTLSFVSTKNKTIMEAHSLNFQNGSITNHAFEANIDLNSVDTLIPIRDQRLRDILFETEAYPIATASLLLPLDLTYNQTIELPFMLNLHGRQMDFVAKVIVQMLDEQMVVINFEPIMVNAKDFGLDDAINQLTKIAGLQSINYEVLVDFKLVFEKSSN